MNDRRFHYSLWLVLVIAFLIRLWGIWNVSTSDEYNEVFEALRQCAGHFNMERWVKRLYLYILAVQYGIYYAVGWVFDMFQSPMHFAEKIIRDMEPLFIIGRFTSVIAGTLTVALVYRIGEKYFNRNTAIISSILLTFSVFHIDLSQQAKVDALLGLLVTATFYFVFKLVTQNSQSKWDYAWCGFFMALAVQTKINSAVLIIPFIVTMLLNYRGKINTARSLAIFTFFFLLGFVIANPPVVLAPLHFLTNILKLTRVFDTPVNVVPSELIGFIAYPLFYYKSMGLLISIATLLALLNAFLDRARKKIVILTFIFPFFLMMGSLKSLVAPYYLIPILPVLFLLVADYLSLQHSRLKDRGLCLGGASRVLLILFISVFFFTPAKNVGYHVFSLSGANTRYLAKDWIEANIPPGSKILMDSGKSINSSAPPVAENRESLERIIRKTNENISQGKIVHEMVDKNALVYYELLLRTVPEKSYDITSTMFGLEVKTIDHYMAEGYQYFIISRERKESRAGNYAKENMPDVARFYTSLDVDKRVHLIQVIAPTLKNSGDTFFIYMLKS